jgi:peptidoglycan/LPS O-acetylase OafA/YrhL
MSPAISPAPDRAFALASVLEGVDVVPGVTAASFGPSAPGFPLPSFIPQFDALRGLAVLSVVAYHNAPIMRVFRLEWLTKLGWAGVDLFFVLSGFLITGILLDSRGTSGYFSTFYIRRALRIWPLYYTFLAVVVIAGHRFSDLGDSLHSTHHWLYYATYLQNVVFNGVFPMQYTWSLAVEEHFYLVWPLLIAALTRQQLVILASLIVISSPVLRGLGAAAGLSWPVIYTVSVFRLDGLAAGALLAIWLRSPRCHRRAVTLAAKCFLAVSVVPAAVLLARFGEYSPWVYSFLCLGSCGMLLFVLAPPPASTVMHVLSWNWLQCVGRISYGIYLMNSVILRLVEGAVRGVFEGHSVATPVLALACVVVQMLFVLGIPTISWFVLERPILALKGRFRYGHPASTAVGALGA